MRADVYIAMGAMFLPGREGACRVVRVRVLVRPYKRIRQAVLRAGVRVWHSPFEATQSEVNGSRHSRRRFARSRRGACSRLIAATTSAPTVLREVRCARAACAVVCRVVWVCRQPCRCAAPMTTGRRTCERRDARTLRQIQRLRSGRLRSSRFRGGEYAQSQPYMIPESPCRKGVARRRTDRYLRPPAMPSRRMQRQRNVAIYARRSILF